MKQLFACALALMLLVSTALAEPLTLGPDLTGVACWPDGSDETTATYVYRYRYPTAAGDDEVSAMINEHYLYLVEDALAFQVPMTGEELAGSEIQSTTTILSEITCNNDNYLSVKVTSVSEIGAAASTVLAAHTFARTGDKAGAVVNLPYMLGILSADETDPWMQERQTAKADSMVLNLIWDIIQQQLARGEVAYYDDLTFDLLQATFYPEEDFYLDESGNPVFFIQEAMVAPASEGVLYFPFSMEELLDEI